MSSIVLHLDFLHFILCLYVHVCECVVTCLPQWMCEGQRTIFPSFLLPCGLLELNSAYAWWHLPLPIDLAHCSSTLHFWDSLLPNLEYASSARLVGQWVSEVHLCGESRLSLCMAFYVVLGIWLRSFLEPRPNAISLCLNYWAYPAGEVCIDHTECPCW